MKRKNKSNWKTVLIAMMIILLGGFGIYILTNQKINLENNSIKDNNLKFNEKESNEKELNEEDEKEKLNNKIKDIKSSLSLITILTSIDKYNAGGDYITKKNKNLLEHSASKQLFVIEQITTNKENYQNFIILNTNGELDKEITNPNEMATFAYYPYNLFIKEYEKYFEDAFQIENRKTSNLNNIYDKDKNYIYYENRKDGLNGLYISEITIDSINQVSSNKYQANLILNYSERLSDMLGVKSENAELIYNKDTIKIDSYMLK